MLFILNAVVAVFYVADVHVVVFFVVVTIFVIVDVDIVVAVAHTVVGAVFYVGYAHIVVVFDEILILKNNYIRHYHYHQLPSALK